MDGEQVIKANEDWLESTSRHLARSFSEPKEDCYQTLALHLLKGESRLGAKQRTVRELMRQKKWLAFNQCCDALSLDRADMLDRYRDTTDLGDWLLVSLSEAEFDAVMWASFSLDQATIAECMGLSRKTINELLGAARLKLEGELYG